MANPSKRKGSQFEKDVADFLKEHGFPLAERRVQGGILDRGDIAGVPNWVLELKNTQQIDLASAQAEALVEAANAGAPFFASVHKKRGRGVRDAYVVMPLWQWCILEANNG